MADTKKRPSDGQAHPTQLRELYQRYRADLVRFARRKVGGGPPDPDDIAQQAFANYAGLQDPSAVKNPRAFLYRTAANLITDFRRSAQHRLNANVGEAELDEILPDHDEISPEIVILDRERFHRVVLAIQSLPRRQARFLLLSRLEGLSNTEIARRCGVSVTTARREVEAAVGACRLAVKKMSDDGED